MFVQLFLLLALIFVPPLHGDDSAHRIKNCEIEIDMLKNNLQSQEEGREKLYREMEESLATVKRYLKEAESNSNEPKQKMSKTMQGLENDFSTLKNHVNQLSSKINDLNSTIASLKKELAGHTASLKSMDEAITLLSKAISPGSTPKRSIPKEGKYIVQSGDSLEKIAKKHGLTTGQLKERNHLSSSVIRVGQELDVGSSD